MKYLCNVAGIKILCEIPFQLTLDEESKEFIYRLQENDLTEADLTIQYCQVKGFSDFRKESCHSVSCRYFAQNENERKMYYCAAPGLEPYACVSWNGEKSGRMRLQYLEGAEQYLNYGRNVIGHIGLENLLWFGNGILLHASFISDDGKGFDIEQLNVESRSDNSGFGLSMMKERVYLLSGEIDISSEINVGTKIKVKVPIYNKEEK